MSQEFDVSSHLVEKLNAWMASNAPGQQAKLVAQGSYGFTKEALLVISDQEVFLLKAKKNELTLEKRESLSNYWKTSSMMGTLQVSFKDDKKKPNIISIAIKEERAKQIKELIEPIQLEFKEKKAAELAKIEAETPKIDKGTYIGGFTPETGIQFYERSSSKYSDRQLSKIFQGGGKPIMVYTKALESDGQVYPIDHLVTADVVFDGQTQVSRRPTLTRMGLLAPLPGTALIAGMALGKKETHDNREVHVIITHPNWSLSVRVKPKDLGPAKSLASRINSIADSLTPANAPAIGTQEAGTKDKAARLKDVKELLDSGFISAEEAEKMKNEILSD